MDTTSGQPTLRRATEHDLDEVVALWAYFMREHALNPAYRLAPEGLQARRDLFAKRLTEPGSALFVLEREDGGLDGMITCLDEENQPYFMPPRYARIQAPYVRADARRKGNLKRLLEAAFAWARERGLQDARLYTGADNLMANAVAEELGFDAIAVIRRRTLRL
jgi:GNAT superfamily N-acetyltransferase